MNLNKEFREGFEAYLSGKSSESNPYSIHEQKENGSWQDGFSAAQAADMLYNNRPYSIQVA